MNSTLKLLVIPVLLSCILAGPVVPSLAQSPSFEEVTTVVAVEVPVQVIKDGEAVHGLTAADFEILQGRKKQEIVDFEVIDLALLQPSSEESSIPNLPVAGRRHFLLLFDLSFSEPNSIEKARTAAQEVVRERVHPSDLIAVGTYAGSRGFQLILGFTSDHRQIEYALETLGLAERAERIEDPLGLLIAELEGEGIGGGSTGGGGGGSRESAILLENLRDLQTFTSRSARDQKQNQILALMSSMEGAARLLRSVQGRVNVILLSEGFETSVVLGSQGSTQEEQERMAEMAAAVTSGETWKVDSDERFGSGAALSGMERMVEEFRRADATIHCVDIGGLSVGGDVQRGGSVGPDRQNSLFVMADGTGGELYRSFNDLGEAMGQMLERTSVTYLLVFQPKDLELDGEFHKLKVRLKGGAKGARVVHRPGYFAPTPFGEQNSQERQLATAGLIMGGREGGSVKTSILALPVGRAGGDQQVPVLIEIDGESLLAGSPEELLRAEIYTYAIGSNGSIGDFFTQALGFDLGEVGEQLRQTGFKFWGQLDLEPGDYALRVLVRNSLSGATSVNMVPLRVPEVDQAEALLLPPLFPEPMGKWILGRTQRAKENTAPYPFTLRETPFMPAARPVLQSGEHTQISLIGFNLGEVSPATEAALVAADGGRVEEVDLVLEERSYADDPEMSRFVATVQVGSAPPGEYVLEVRVLDSSTGASRTSSIPVVIAG
ncbi:MAG: VWA domain-containing protein [Thermoanaerobaculia bacterium]